MVAHGQPVHFRSGVRDDSGSFVAQDKWLVGRPVAVDDVQVGVADAGGPDVDPDLAAPGRRDMDRLDAQSGPATEGDSG